MNIDEINDEYFAWLSDKVCKGRFSKDVSYSELLHALHKTEFRWKMRNDANRASDGLMLRRRFASFMGFEEDYFLPYITGPCTVLEMMIALAIRCEVSIMDNPKVGDRTAQWFWEMINNMELGGMYNNNFDKFHVNDVIDRFIDREYSPNGKGGLFYIRNCKCDLAMVEIWDQMCWYLNGIS